MSEEIEEIEEIKSLIKWTRGMGLLHEANLLNKLLDLYNEEKQKNKENIEVIEEWINGERISPVIEQKYISKDKIKEAMKDCVSSYDCLKEKINILLYGDE